MVPYLVSFAAVQYIKQQFSNLSGKKILLLGIGKIGRSTCKNLVDYLETAITRTLINRTADKAAELANELGLLPCSIRQLPQYIDNSDIILVATNAAAHPTILKTHLEGKNRRT